MIVTVQSSVYTHGVAVISSHDCYWAVSCLQSVLMIVTGQCPVYSRLVLMIVTGQCPVYSQFS